MATDSNEGQAISPDIARPASAKKAPAKKARKRRESFGSVRLRDSGRYQASYVGLDGRRHFAPNMFAAMKDARAWLAKIQVKLDADDWQAHETAAEEAAKKLRAETFSKYSERWISTRTNRHGEHLRPRTAAEYRRLLRSPDPSKDGDKGGPLHPFADKRLQAITPDDVRTWYSDIVLSGTKTTAARAYELLKAILTTAVQDGRIRSNPCQVRGGASASTGREVTPPTAAELQRIVDAIEPRYKAAVILAAWTGVRYGELTELRRKDLQLVTNGDRLEGVIVNVSRAVSHVTGQGYIVGPPKSEAGVRSIVLPPHVVPIVERHLREHVGRFPESLLFPASDGASHLAQSSFAKHWDPAREAAGREDMPWHALRHYGATRAALAGATLKELQTRLGHSTVAAAMTYQHTAGRDEEIARRMSDLA